MSDEYENFLQYLNRSDKLIEQSSKGHHRRDRWGASPNRGALSSEVWRDAARRVVQIGGKRNSTRLTRPLLRAT